MIKIVNYKLQSMVKIGNVYYANSPHAYEVQTGLFSNEAANELDKILRYPYLYFNDNVSKNRPGALSFQAYDLVQEFKRHILFANDGRSKFGSLMKEHEHYEQEYVIRNKDGEISFYVNTIESDLAILNIIRAMFGIYLFETGALNNMLECVDNNSVAMKIFVALGLKTTCDVEITNTEDVKTDDVVGTPLNPFEQVKCREYLRKMHGENTKLWNMISTNGMPKYSILGDKCTMLSNDKDCIYTAKVHKKVAKIISLYNDIMRIKL